MASPGGIVGAAAGFSHLPRRPARLPRDARQRQLDGVADRHRCTLAIRRTRRGDEQASLATFGPGQRRRSLPAFKFHEIGIHEPRSALDLGSAAARPQPIDLDDVSKAFGTCDERVEPRSCRSSLNTPAARRQPGSRLIAPGPPRPACITPAEARIMVSLVMDRPGFSSVVRTAGTFFATRRPTADPDLSDRRRFRHRSKPSPHAKTDTSGQ